LFLFQTIFALIKYKKISSFHTYLAKLAAFLQGIFFLHLYFTGNPNYWLFYGMAFITAIELVEEICLVAMLDDWTPNVKGLYWVKKRA
jgi:CDP-diacylglycerol--glycerol-3-phosphate 3-phosphatidyltransferase